MTMRTAIIEDEAPSRVALRNMIRDHCPQLEVVGEAVSVKTALELLNESEPQLLFLDIQLPDGTAFDVLEQLPDRQMHVIFVTAHDEFAVQAFQYHALHYLMKPLVSEELVEAVSRVSRQQGARRDVAALFQQLRSVKGTFKVAVPSASKVNFLDMDEIIRCESEGVYTHIHTRDGEHLLSSKLLKDYEALLHSKGFMRIHRSHLINLSEVREFKKTNTTGVAVMSDGSKVEISRANRPLFIEAMQAMSM